MKKSILTFSFALLALVAFGQSLQKGNLLGVHVFTIKLNPDATMNQYTDLLATSVIPEYAKAYPGGKAILAKGIRGENANSIAVFFVFESEKVRDKYFNADGSGTELNKAASDKMQPAFDKLNKLGTSTSKYTDWLIQ